MRIFAGIAATLLMSQMSFAHQVEIDPISGHVTPTTQPPSSGTDISTEPGSVTPAPGGDLQIGGGAAVIELGKVYKIVNLYSNKCLDVRDHSLAPGAPVQQWDCHGGANQQFRVIDGGNSTIILEGVESGQTLMIADALMDDGAPLIQTFETVGNAALFHIKPTALAGNFTIVTGQAGKCLDIAGLSKDNGASILQATCKDTQRNQSWMFIPL